MHSGSALRSHSTKKTFDSRPFVGEFCTSVLIYKGCFRFLLSVCDHTVTDQQPVSVRCFPPSVCREISSHAKKPLKRKEKTVFECCGWLFDSSVWFNKNTRMDNMIQSVSWWNRFTSIIIILHQYISCISFLILAHLWCLSCLITVHSQVDVHILPFMLTLFEFGVMALYMWWSGPKPDSDCTRSPQIPQHLMDMNWGCQSIQIFNRH